MKHSVNELYKIDGNKFCTQNYLKANDIAKSHKVMHVINKKEIKINTTNGLKIGYMYGEKIWFDTEKERTAYKEEQNRKHTEVVSRNKVIKAINERLAAMDEEKLIELLKIL